MNKKPPPVTPPDPGIVSRYTPNTNGDGTLVLSGALYTLIINTSNAWEIAAGTTGRRLSAGDYALLVNGTVSGAYFTSGGVRYTLDDVSGWAVANPA